MVNKFGTIARKTMSDLMTNASFGIGSTYTAVRYTKTIDSMGQPSAISTATYAIVGDLQPITADDHALIEQGYAQLGDANFYTYDSSGLATVPKEGDKLLGDNGDEYEIARKDESPKVGRDEMHIKYYCKRRDLTGGTDSF
jgi:hypothetical protein